VTHLDIHSRLGIDVGRVLVGASADGGEPDSSFLTAEDAQAIRIPPEPRAFDVVREAFERTDGHVHVVSKCGPRIQRLTRLWLHHQGFFELTGVSPEHVHFVLKRPQKAALASQLGLTHFVDDRLDVLEPMRTLVGTLIWFGGDRASAPTWVTCARDWTDVRVALLGRE
jgi:hypothetical protein